MFLSFPGRYYGSDNVVRYKGSWNNTRKPWDLLLVGGHYAVVLGAEIARWCDYELSETSIHVAESGLLSPQSISLAHRMIREYYTSYRKVLPLWLTSDIDNLLKRKPQTPSTSPSWPHLIKSWTRRVRWDHKTQGQQCLIFPDLWTIHSMVSEQIRTHKDVAICSSSMTEKQRNDARWSVKYGKKRIILSTPAAFFHDWHQLASMDIIDPHLRYYKNRQQPRFGVSDVVEQWKSYIQD